MMKLADPDNEVPCDEFSDVAAELSLENAEVLEKTDGFSW